MTTSGSRRVIIAFCFGALLEALAGFGTPVAITSVMLIALGFKPIKAATVALVANTAPVAFGALAVPITTLATVTNIPEHTLAQMVGRQTPLLGVFVPMALVFIIDRWRGVRETLPATLVCGIVFALAQFTTSNYLSTQLTDIVASLLGAAAIVLLLRVWRPAHRYVEEPDLVPAGGAVRVPASDRCRPAAGAGQPAVADGLAATDVARRGPGRGPTTAGGRTTRSAWAPGRPTSSAPGTSRSTTATATWSGRTRRTSSSSPCSSSPRCRSSRPCSRSRPRCCSGRACTCRRRAGKPSTIPTYKLNWLSAAGTLLIIAGLITIPVIGISLRQAWKAYVDTYRQLAGAIVTVMAVLALAYVMNASGQTATLGAWMAGAGAVFALISPILGWLGVAVTGSDTSSNSLFGALQVTAAHQTGLNPVLMAAANSSGGVLGKMISPQNLAIAAAAVGLSGREGDVFRKVLGWSLGFLAFMCVLVYLQSTPVLSWMVP